MIGGLIGLFMAFVGAFGSFAAPLLVRLVYWVPAMILGGMIGAGASALLSRQPKVRDNRWLLGIGTWFLVSTASVVLFWGWGEVVFGRGQIGDLLNFSVGVYGVGAAVTALMMALFHPSPVTSGEPVGTTPALPPPAAPRFLQRLPAAQRGAEIFAVAAEDHYLRVFTSAGEAMILLRLSDAIAELDGIKGAQTHRSWWVARAAVVSASRADGRASLTLKNGIIAPVSRPNIAPLRADGWFTP